MPPRNIEMVLHSSELSQLPRQFPEYSPKPSSFEIRVEYVYSLFDILFISSLSNPPGNNQINRNKSMLWDSHGDDLLTGDDFKEADCCDTNKTSKMIQRLWNPSYPSKMPIRIRKVTKPPNFTF